METQSEVVPVGTLAQEITNYLAGDDGLVILDPSTQPEPDPYFVPFAIYSLVPIGANDPGTAAGPEARRMLIVLIQQLNALKIKSRMTAYTPPTSDHAASLAVLVQGFAICLTVDVEKPDGSPNSLRSLRFTASIGVAEDDSTS